MREKDFRKIKTKRNICIDVLGHKSRQEFENSMDLLLVNDEKKSHYVYIKGFDRFMFHKTNNTTKIIKLHLQKLLTVFWW